MLRGEKGWKGPGFLPLSLASLRMQVPHLVPYAQEWTSLSVNPQTFLFLSRTTAVRSENSMV